MFSISQLKVNFESKNLVLPIEKFPFLVLARDTMLQHHIIHFLLHYLSSGRLREVKNKAQFQTMSSKSGRCRSREVVATRGSKYSDLIVGIVAEERWLLKRWSQPEVQLYVICSLC